MELADINPSLVVGGLIPPGTRMGTISNVGYTQGESGVHLDQTFLRTNRAQKSWFEIVFGAPGNQSYTSAGAISSYYLDDEVFKEIQYW